MARLVQVLLSEAGGAERERPLGEIGLEHIGGSLRVLAKAGLGLLSYGLNRLLDMCTLLMLP
jgi:hypothetical protein